MNEGMRYSAALLDANIGSTNITEKDKIQTMVFNTFDTITATLQQHCGPYSAFAITHKVSDQVSEPVFTNDGINIVKTMSFLNPIQDFARRNIAYIGSRVETKVGDGTTTAMILASSFMKYMSDPKNIPLQEVLSQVSYTELVNLYNQTVKEILKAMDKSKAEIAIHDPTFICKVAYCQAYTSSHGDIELSTAIASLFAELPPEAWPYIYYYREGSETNVRYTVKSDSDQFSSKVSVMNKNMLNWNLGTEFYRENTDLFVYTDLLTVSNETLWMPLKTAIQNAVINDTPLVILCPDNTDGFTRQSIMSLLAEDKNHVVALFTHHMEHPTLNDFRILTLLSKQPDLQARFYVIPNVRISCKGHTLTVNNIYEPDYKSVFNPLIKDENYPLFKQQVDAIKSLIDQAKEEAVNRDTVHEITHYVSIYNRLIFNKKLMIVVGGLAYDNSAAMDVLMDTVNAVNKSLTEGYSGGSNTAFCSALLKIHSLYSSYAKYKDRDDVRENKLIFFMTDAFLNALRDIYSGISYNVNGYVPSADPVELVEYSDNTNCYLNYDAEKGWKLENLFEAIDSSELDEPTSSVIQPADLIPEVLTRIGEVCLKWLKTNNIVTEDGVYTPPKKRSWFKRLLNR